MNRLGNATSPYLQQHADNPVDWWEWGEEALAEAKRRDVPLLLSVGYSACHWCHVMAHESFEDKEVADVVNVFTVPVKVDREERPDVDAVYMAATQATTGQGGWPMTVFATPDGQPFYCGTYFSREQFLALLQAVHQAWGNQRADIIAQGQRIVAALTPTAPSTRDVSPQRLDAAVDQLSQAFDEVNGGFGGAPKFPPAMCLLFLLRHHERTGDPRALEMVRHTCERMARGGMYDQLAGGFARYAVDARWVVPHFEKMLYDNALLLRVYTQLWRLTGDALAARIAGETADFLIRDMTTGQGALAAALDADTGGVEGLTYVWTPAQLIDVLGAEDGGWAADLFDVTDPGTFERGTSVLQLSRDIDDATPEVVERWRRVRHMLLIARGTRRQPARDDKIVSAWNGLAVTALAEYTAVRAALTGMEPTEAAPTGDESARVTSARALAVRSATLLAESHIVDGRLRRVSRDGAVGAPEGVLEDYGCVAEAFCAIHQLTGEGRWLDLAGRLLDVALAHFGDGDGGFYDTADYAAELVIRPRDASDGATPSGVTALAGALLTYAALSGHSRYREAAGRALAGVMPMVERHPRFAGWAAAVAEAYVGGPWEVAIVGDDGTLAAAAWRHAPGGSVIVTGAPDQQGVPLLADRPLIGDAPTAYTCKGFVCDLPVTDPLALTESLKASS